jgi:hypothetical protein
MLLGDLTTFKSYRKKNPLLAKQIDTKFIIKSPAPRKTLTGEPGDYLAIDDNGDSFIIKKEDFESTYELIDEEKQNG